MALFRVLIAYNVLTSFIPQSTQQKCLTATAAFPNLSRVGIEKPGSSPGALGFFYARHGARGFSCLASMLNIEK